MRGRGAALASFGAGAVFLLVGLGPPARPEPPASWIVDITRPPAETCGKCHEDVHAEWEPTLHKRAWTNGNIQNATQSFARAECRPCHSPHPVLPNGLEIAPRVYRPPRFREENVESGVHCLSCHGLGNGSGVAAARDVPEAPCRPRRDDRLLSVAFCATCHDPTHQAAQEYWTSAQARDGIGCRDCHMPPVARADGRKGRSHVFPGGFDHAQVRRGVAVKSSLEGRTVVVSLTNQAAHKLPGEIPSRGLVVSVRAFDAAGARVLDRHTLFRRPFKNAEERHRPDDRLLPGETRVLREPLPAGAVRATVDVVFRSLPLQPDWQAIPIASLEHAVK